MLIAITNAFIAQQSYSASCKIHTNLLSMPCKSTHTKCLFLVWIVTYTKVNISQSGVGLFILRKMFIGFCKWTLKVLSAVCSILVYKILGVFLPLFYTFIAKIETANEREEKSMTCNKDPWLELHGQCCSNLSAAKHLIISDRAELYYTIHLHMMDQ